MECKRSWWFWILPAALVISDYLSPFASKASIGLTIFHAVIVSTLVWFGLYYFNREDKLHTNVIMDKMHDLENEVSIRHIAETKLLQFRHDALLAASQGKLELCLSSDELPIPTTPFEDEREIQAETLSEIRHSAASHAKDLGFSPARLAALETCIGEAAMNALRHGHGGEIAFSFDSETVYCRVVDHGQGIDPQNLPFATLQDRWSAMGTAGLGYTMMLSEADKLFLLTGVLGTTLILCLNKIQKPFVLDDSYLTNESVQV